MIDSIQILLFTVVITLTILMVIIGWQIFQILSEIRKMLMKFNVAIDNALSITGDIGKSLHNLTGFSEGLKAVFGVFRLFHGKEEKNDK